jgi:hypothetical protein
VDSHYVSERDRIAARPCECVSCADCGGSGNVCVDAFSGRYIGAHPVDDFYDLTPCDNCHGGIVEQCDRCSELRELEDAYASVDRFLDECGL